MVLVYDKGSWIEAIESRSSRPDFFGDDFYKYMQLTIIDVTPHVYNERKRTAKNSAGIEFREVN